MLNTVLGTLYREAEPRGWHLRADDAVSAAAMAGSPPTKTHERDSYYEAIDVLDTFPRFVLRARDGTLACMVFYIPTRPTNPEPGETFSIDALELAKLARLDAGFAANYALPALGLDAVVAGPIGTLLPTDESDE